ncbi:MAG TPA: hypothetical protein VFM79_07055 [Pelobium sp.]|nr:hypothetical protein [Pelobium sp.]
MTNSFLYFGYGCALNPTLVEFRVNQPVEIICSGEIKDYTLKFNRKNPDGTARANLSPVTDDFTLGLVYKISKSKFEQLGQTEPEYSLSEFDVFTENGTVTAYAFICHHCEDEIVPDKKEVNRIAEYAKLLGFPESYIDKILSALPEKTI